MNTLSLRRFLARLPLLTNPFSAAAGPLRELRHHSNRASLAHHPPLQRFFALGLSALIWPFWSAWLVRKQVRRHGKSIQKITGGSLLALAGHQWVLAQIHFLHPRDYIYFNFWRDRAQRPSDFISDWLSQGLFRSINLGADTALLDDKRAFHDFCLVHDLATAPVIAVIDRSRVEPLHTRPAFAQDLFFKPRRGAHARNTALWRFTPATNRYAPSHGGPSLTWTELQSHCVRLAATEDFIVQPRLRDHPALADLSNGSLSTIRLVTVIHPDGRPREFASIFNIPTRTAFRNNLTDGALASAIESATGRLRAAFLGTLGKPLYTQNPFNAAPLAGRPLPFWREAVALAEAAHARLPAIAVIGWDVALTADGPLLLEGNHQIGLNFHQLPPNPPLGQTDFPSFLLHHLQRKISPA